MAFALLLMSTNAVAGMDGSAFVGLYTLFAMAVCIVALLIALSIRGINNFLTGFAALLFILSCLLFVQSWFAYASELKAFNTQPTQYAIYFLPSLGFLFLALLYLFTPASNKTLRKTAASILFLACLGAATFFAIAIAS